MKRKLLIVVMLAIATSCLINPKAFAADDWPTLPSNGMNGTPIIQGGLNEGTPVSSNVNPGVTQPESGGNAGGSAASAPAQNPPAQNIPASTPQPAPNTPAYPPQPAQSTPDPQPAQSAAPTVSPAPTPGVTPQTSEAPQPTPESAPSEPAAQAPAETPGDSADRYLRVAVVLALTAMLFVAVMLNTAAERRKKR